MSYKKKVPSTQLNSVFSGNLASRFNFDIQTLGIDGMKEWLLESLETRDSFPPLGYFMYDDDIGILDMFRAVSDELSINTKSILLKSVEGVLSQSEHSKLVDTFFLYSSARILETLNNDINCKSAYKHLANHFDALVNSLNPEISFNERQTSSIVDYRDALEFCLDATFLALKEKTLKKEGSNNGLYSLKPILEHAQFSLETILASAELKGLNIAYMPLVMLATVNITLEERSLSKALIKTAPLWRKVKDGLQYNFLGSLHEDVKLFNHPIEPLIRGPYNLQHFDGKMKKIIEQTLESMKLDNKNSAHHIKPKIK